MKKISAIATIITVSAMLGAGAIIAKPVVNIADKQAITRTDTLPGEVRKPMPGQVNPLPPQATPNAMPNPNTTPTPVPGVTPVNPITPGVAPTPTPTPMPGVRPTPGVNPTPTMPVTPNPATPGTTPMGGVPRS